MNSIKIFLKQLFCRHIYKSIKTEILRTSKEFDCQLGGVYYYDTHEYYAEEYLCIKCGKKKIIEKRKLII